MNTGIFIRAEIDGKWKSVDIGDSQLPNTEVVKWLRSRGGDNRLAERCVMILLGRDQTTVNEVADEQPT